MEKPFSSVAPTLWASALERARAEAGFGEDQAVYDYLCLRGLEESWEHGAYGILSAGMDLPTEVAGWPGSGYRIIAPLLDLNGLVVNVQARRINQGKPKTLLPRGSSVRGTVFASRSGVALLRNQTRAKSVLLAEGLTDYLALSIAAPVPVLSAPGTSFFESAIGPWVKGTDLYLAADQDQAGTACIEPTARAAYRAGARTVSFINWPKGCKDACDALGELGAVGLAEFLERELSAGGSCDAFA